MRSPTRLMQCGLVVEDTMNQAMVYQSPFDLCLLKAACLSPWEFPLCCSASLTLTDVQSNLAQMGVCRWSSKIQKKRQPLPVGCGAKHGRLAHHEILSTLGLKVSHGDPYRAVSVSALAFSWGFSIGLVFPRVSTPSIVDGVKSGGSQNYILVST